MTTAFVIAFLSLWAVALTTRVLIFKAEHADPDVRELLDDHLMIQRDVLFWKLWRLRTKIALPHRWKVAVYFWTNVTAISVAVIGAAVYLWLRQ